MVPLMGTDGKCSSQLCEGSLTLDEYGCKKGAQSVEKTTVFALELCLTVNFLWGANY